MHGACLNTKPLSLFLNLGSNLFWQETSLDSKITSKFLVAANDHYKELKESIMHPQH